MSRQFTEKDFESLHQANPSGFSFNNSTLAIRHLHEKRADGRGIRKFEKMTGKTTWNKLLPGQVRAQKLF